MNKGIFIAATGQHVGKTTLCLGILSGLKKRLSSVGFLKPVGQQHVTSDEGTEVDKDVILFKDHFHLSPSYAAMSPVICPQGFTRDFLDHKVTEEKLLEKILKSYRNLAKDNEFVLVEGTGHIGVGSIFHLNNAKIAKYLGLDVVMIATGGLGSTFDELALNISMCRAYGVKVRGVILNKVQPSKRDMILEYFPKSLETYHIPLIGCIPFESSLSMPMMKDYEVLFESTLLSGTIHRDRHFAEIKLITGSLETFKEEMAPNELIVTDSCREDIITQTIENEKNGYSSALILTGRKSPSEKMLHMLKTSTLPVLYVSLSAMDAVKLLSNFTAKIRNEDEQKVETAIKLVEDNLNFQLLMQSCSDPAESTSGETVGKR